MAEAYKGHEIETAPELREQETPEVKVSEANTESQQLDVAEIRQKLLEQPEEPLELPLDDSSEGNQPQYIDRAVKQLGLKRELSNIRTNLPASQRIFSSLVHSKALRASSELAARTVARPNGLLAGGVLAFSGSLILLLIDKYTGVRYNYLLFALLFVAGYLLSVAIEFLQRRLKHKA